MEENKTYSITLSDGTIINDLTLNGNNYISKTPILEETFTNNCSPVIINDGLSDDIHEHMELDQIEQQANGDYWFVLTDVAPGIILRMRMQSDIDYLAMMSGIEL